MPTNTSTTKTIEMNIRFNRALETFTHFASKWDETDRRIFTTLIKKDLAEAQPGNKENAGKHLTDALFRCFRADRGTQFYWGRKGQQDLGEAIHDFVSVAILCLPNHVQQIHQFCQKICPEANIPAPQKATEFQKGMDAYRQRTCLFSH